jgi:hypothetical protein
MSRLDHLGAAFQLTSELLDICAREGRQPTDAELAMITAPPSSLATRSLPVVRVGREVATYAPPDARNGERVSFFRDLLHAQLDGDPDCRARIERHSLEVRAVGTNATSPGVVPPTWLFQEFAVLQHGARPWADQLRRVPIDNANPVNIGRQVTPAATVGAQVNQGDPAADGSFNANLLQTQPATLTGKVDVSRQLLDGSNPAVDGLVYADCMGAYNEAVEQAVVNAFEALVVTTGFGVLINYPGTPAYANLPDALIDAATSLAKRRKIPATHALVSAGAWAYLGKQKDQQGRPLVTTGTQGPTNSYGLSTADYSGGEVVGLQVIPSWAGVDNHIYVIVAADSLLLESPTFNFRYEEVLGPSAIRLGVWGYAAPVLGRYPSGIVKIDAGATIPAPLAEEDTEVTTAKAK